MKALGIILAGGNNNKMQELSTKRATAAMPVGGSYRCIDFALSNNALWVCHSGGVQLVALNYPRSGFIAPLIRFDDIKVNDRSVPDFPDPQNSAR